MKRTTFFVLALYSILLDLGGIMAYVQKGSAISLVSALIMGTLIAVAAVVFFNGKKAGLYAASWLTASFTLLFLIRYFLTSKTVPALLATLSGTVLFFLLTQLGKWKKLPNTDK